MKLSLILPIYNVEEYIPKCLNSIYSQGLKESEFEVIAVIDGSPDNSLNVVNSYTLHHSNLIVINKENEGVSSARNKGIELARGEYIMFIDPDDTLISGALMKIHEVLNTVFSEIFILRSYNDSDKEQFAWKNLVDPNTLYSGLKIYDKGYTRGGVWGCLYNRQFILNNKLYFPLNIRNSEDAFFFMKCQIKSTKIQFLDIDTYLLYSRPGSASQDMSEERLSQWFNTLHLLKQFKQKESRSSIEISLADGLIYSIISDITKNSIKTLGWKAKKFLLDHEISSFLPICKDCVNRSSFIHKLMKSTINISYNLFFCVTYIRVKVK